MKELYDDSPDDSASVPSNHNNDNQPDVSQREKEVTPSDVSDPFSSSLLKIYGDGNCLFKAVAMAGNIELIDYGRSPSGMPVNRLMAEIEDSTAKDLRKQTIRLWEENRQIYKSHAKDLGFTPFVTEDLRHQA